jgi:hypothetical protein
MDKCPVGTVSLQDVAPIISNNHGVHYAETYSNYHAVEALKTYFMENNIFVDKMADMYVLFKNSALGMLVEFTAGCTNGAVIFMTPAAVEQFLEVIGKAA